MKENWSTWGQIRLILADWRSELVPCLYISVSLAPLVLFYLSGVISQRTFLGVSCAFVSAAIVTLIQSKVRCEPFSWVQIFRQYCRKDYWRTLLVASCLLIIILCLMAFSTVAMAFIASGYSYMSGTLRYLLLPVILVLCVLIPLSVLSYGATLAGLCLTDTACGGRRSIRSFYRHAWQSAKTFMGGLYVMCLPLWVLSLIGHSYFEVNIFNMSVWSMFIVWVLWSFKIVTGLFVMSYISSFYRHHYITC